MSHVCYRTKPWIPSNGVRFAIFGLLAYLMPPTVDGCLNSPPTRIESRAQPLDTITAGATFGEQCLIGEPNFLNLGTGIYLIKDRQGGEADAGSYGRRKRAHQHHSLSIQCNQHPGPALDVPHPMSNQNGVRMLIQDDTDKLVDTMPRKTARMGGDGGQYIGLPGYIAKYFVSTQLSINRFERNLGPHILGQEIFHNNMRDYIGFRNNHVKIVGENNKNRRDRRIMQANDHFGFQETSGLGLLTKEVKLAKYLLVNNLPFWKPVPLFSAIVEVIRSMRTALYRIRIIGQMFEPPLFKTPGEQVEAQKDAFELLKNFWKKDIFPAVFEEEAKKRLNEANHDSFEALMKLALSYISKRPGQPPALRTSLSWVVTEYWLRKKLSETSIELYKQMGIFVYSMSKNGSGETINHSLKMYHADKAVSEAPQAGGVESDYKIVFMAQFKLSVPIKTSGPSQCN